MAKITPAPLSSASLDDLFNSAALLNSHANDPDVHGLAVINERVQLNTTAISRPQKSWTIVVQDSFNRSDNSTLGTPTIGPDWLAGYTMAYISGNTARSNPANADGLYGGLQPTRSRDMRVTVVQNMFGTSGEASILARYTDGNNMLYLSRDPSNIGLVSIVGGVSTTIGSYFSPPLVDGETMVLEAVGDVATVLLNGVVLFQAPSTHSGATCGIRLTGLSKIDSFLVESETGGLLKLVQDDLKIMSPYSIVAKDNFNRTDGVLAGTSSSTGALVWANPFSVTANIVGNKVVSADGSTRANLIAATFADAAVSLDITLTSVSAGDAWIYFRYNTGPPDGLLLQRNNNNTLIIYAQVGGPSTTIATVATPAATNGVAQRMTVVGIGSKITVLVAGIVVYSFDNATSLTTTTHGLRLSGSATVDNFRIMSAEAL